MADPVTAPFQPLRVQLRDGSEVVIRSIREDDAEKFQASIRGLSEDSRYTRFFSPLRELSPQMLDRATHPDGHREVQLVAVAGADERIVGGTRFVATETAGDCEFSIIVADDWHGRGLARVLMEALMRTAREHGFLRMEGYVLAGNAAMLGLAKRLGFARLPCAEGPTVWLVRRDLCERKDGSV